MWITQEGIRVITNGTDVDGSTIITAQRIIEAYVGRTEADVTNPRDVSILARATAFQAAYMKTNGKAVFEQVNVAQMVQGGVSLTFRGDDDSPYIAPLAKIACRHLSWKKPRSVKTGRVFQRRQLASWWTD